VPPLADKPVKGEDSTLPDPELNPLSNPLLAANLGRWAEVYFTNPPEKRTQAVSALLKVLETEAATKSAAGSESAASAHEKTNPSTPPEMITERSKGHATLACNTCGHLNDRGKKFCVMCGSSLAGSQEAGVIEDRITEEVQPNNQENIDREEDSTKEFSRENIDAAYDHESTAGMNAADPIIAFGDERRQQPDEARYSRRVIDEDELDLPHFAREPEPVPYRHRLYIGLVIAALLGGLIYLARNRTDVFSGNQESPASRTMPAAPQPAPEASEPASRAAAPLPVEKAETPAPPPAPVPGAQEVPQNAKQMRAQPKPLSANTEIAQNGNSSAETAEAQKYLNQRDGRDAAPWLWKAVAKGNGGATVILADLYLRGDGVPKNCDQGRLLLDIAAKKGAKGAAEQLRNLQAFGCQ
jgi:hypothetical protein